MSALSVPAPGLQIQIADVAVQLRVGHPQAAVPEALQASPLGVPAHDKVAELLLELDRLRGKVDFPLVEIAVQ